MRSIGILLIISTCATLSAAQEATQSPDSPPGLVILKSKRERNREQPSDVRSTASSPDALNNGGLMPSGGGNQFPNFVYDYSVQIRNDSPRGIKWLSWIYLVSDANSKQQLDRQEVVSFEKISPGQKKTLHDRKRLSPSRANADEREKKNGHANEERVRFICVAYDDGSLWHSASTTESQCRDAEKRRKSN
jgi:hypothetical protein